MALGINFIICVSVMYQHWIISMKNEKYKEENVELLAER